MRLPTQIDFTEKIAVVTGGSRGIDRAIAIRLAHVVFFLCSNLAKMIHSQTIIVDGGHSIEG